MKKILTGLYKEFGLIKMLLFGLLMVTVIVGFIWTANRNQELTEKAITAVRVEKDIYRLDFERKSNNVGFEKSVAKFREDHPGQRIALYTLPKEMWPDPEKPVVYIFAETFEEYKK